MLPKFKSLLCLNGRLPNKSWFLKYNHLVLIAADGASNQLISNNIIPNFIIGDLDSLDKQYLSINSHIINIKDQNSTDFEKSLVEMKRRELFPSLILGINGGEIDHSIYNLNCFMQHAKQHELVFLDSDENNKLKWGIPLFTTKTFINKTNATISLLPFPEAIVSTKGLKWDITNQFYSVTTAASVRNIIINKQATIQVHSGTLLIILDN